MRRKWLTVVLLLINWGILMVPGPIVEARVQRILARRKGQVAGHVSGPQRQLPTQEISSARPIQVAALRSLAALQSVAPDGLVRIAGTQPVEAPGAARPHLMGLSTAPLGFRLFGRVK